MDRTFRYADLEQDLPTLSPASRVCVLSVFLLKSMRSLKLHAEIDSLPAVQAAPFISQIAGCLNRLSREYSSQANIALRQLHANTGSVVEVAGKAFGSYCEAAEHHGIEMFHAIFKAIDRDAFIAWLLRRAGQSAEYPNPSTDDVEASWQAVRGSVESLPLVEIDDLLLRVEGEHLALQSPIGTNSGSVQPFVPNKLQKEILAALNGRALKADDLAIAVCGGDRRRLYNSKTRTGDLHELVDKEFVGNKPRLGYFRIDAPPK